MTAALNLADQGFKVHLVERDKELGGNFRHIHSLLTGEDPQKKLAETVERINSHEINIYSSMYVKRSVA